MKAQCHHWGTTEFQQQPCGVLKIIGAKETENLRSMQLMGAPKASWGQQRAKDRLTLGEGRRAHPGEDSEAADPPGRV